MDLFTKAWSFSSVKLFATCPYAFYLRYIKGEKESPNAFSQHGTLVHSLLERYFKGELFAFELADLFEQEYANVVTEQFPFYNMYKSYYDKTLQYLQNFEGIDGEVLSVEQKLESIIGGHKFIGYADLMLRDDNGIVVIDHKSHAKWASKREREEYFRQLYLYAHVVKEMYGEFPRTLSFNRFRIPDEPMDSVVFRKEDYDVTLDWFKRIVDTILKEDNWECRVNDFYCKSLCGMRECIYNG